MVWIQRTVISCAIIIGLSIFLIYMKQLTDNEDERENTVYAVYVFLIFAITAITIGNIDICRAIT